MTATQVTTGELTDEQHRELAAWRFQALLKMPYFASVLYAMRPVNTPGLGTFGVDPHLRLYIDFDAVADWSADYKAEALLHECSHVLQDHAAQAEALGVKDHERMLWNMAGDCAINDDLRDAGCTHIANNGLLPSTYGMPDYQPPASYFEHLKRTMKPPSASGSGCGSGAGAPAGDHELPSQAGSTPATEGASAGEVERVRIQTAAAIKDAASKAAGRVPGGLKTWAEQTLEPSKIPWNQLLARAMRGAVTSAKGQMEQSYQRRDSRRHNERILTPSGSGRRVVVPGAVDYIPRIVVVRDTSGSMSDDELNQVTSEVDAISRRLRVKNENLVVLDVDTEVAAARRYSGPGTLAMASGRGGTNMVAGIEAAMAMKPRPTAVVVVTDGYTPWPTGSAPSRKTKFIACITRGGATTESVPDWIQVVRVDEN